MIETSVRRDKNIAIFGLGVSGIATANALARGGVQVSAWDDDAAARETAGAQGVVLADPRKLDWSEIDALVLSPGVPLTHPEPHEIVRLAQGADCPILGDIELLAEACPDATYIAITGTNGKSTTTALIGHVLRANGLTIQIGGNLGPPALSLEPLGGDGAYVLELSSYQLDLTHEARFDIALLLNLSPDHLDRHGGMDGYIAAKNRIFRDRPDGGQVAIIGVDDAHGVALADDIAATGKWRVIRISSGAAVEGGVYAIDGKLFDHMDGAHEVCDLTSIPTLPGAHNRQNAAACYAVARIMGLQPGDIAEKLASYAGLAHRQETIARISGIEYVNDSKATNPDAASRALGSYDAIYWIAGGRAKDGGLGPVLAMLGRVRHAFLIGEAEEAFAEELTGRNPFDGCGDLSSALSAAHELAQAENIEGAVVLLSPACASFDQWPNFEARGDAFRDQVLSFAREGGR
ncbi:MAG: UDP-N-acetylmuramoyl-L-alanine--D-glutamate ligase [Pseudomonadota bacterium]|nr:UDP-N-acetylmuramoyl-L-alanine--D-glutamate ligase [Pseudomonadota bacterium]